MSSQADRLSTNDWVALWKINSHDMYAQSIEQGAVVNAAGTAKVGPPFARQANGCQPMHSLTSSPIERVP
jgi:hypothetical protein